MNDDLSIPQVPEPKPEDPEDVSWALSTAEAMWARGDHSEGIKWVRRAAEAASEAEIDTRALELAKIAADLAAMISRMSRVAIEEDLVPIAPSIPPPVPAMRPAAGRSMPPPAGGSVAPRKTGAPGSVTKQVATPSRPPGAPPSKTTPSGAPPPSARASKPLGTNTPKPASLRPGAIRQETRRDTKDAKKSARRSREGLEAEADASAASSGAPRTTSDSRVDEGWLGAAGVTPASDTAPHAVMLPTDTVEVPARPRDASQDPTLVGTQAPTASGRDARRSAAEWDADSTQNLTGDDFFGERRTIVSRPPPEIKASMQALVRGRPASQAPSAPSGSSPPATMANAVLGSMGAAASQTPSSTPRGGTDQADPGIVTSQAVRVVVWRDANGVHVAPAGTIVSAITVDAVLVALEPSADLTAWLTQRKGR